LISNLKLPPLYVLWCLNPTLSWSFRRQMSSRSRVIVLFVHSECTRSTLDFSPCDTVLHLITRFKRLERRSVLIDTICRKLSFALTLSLLYRGSP
jgi:hypothetical protein